MKDCFRMMTSTVIMSIMIFSACIFSGCKNPEIVFNLENEESESVKNQGYALDLELEQLANVEVKGRYNQNSETITCEITAPDMYTYVMNKVDILAEMDTEQLYEELLRYASDDTSSKRVIELELPVEYYDEKLYVDTSSFEYQDAVRGGLNSAMTELFIQSIKSMEERVME